MDFRRRSVIVLATLTIPTATALRAQTACDGLLVPLKPPAMFSCPTATTVCVSNQGVPRGHWVWMCPAGATPGNASGLDPSIIQRGTQAPSATPLSNPIDTAIEIERLRSLRIQNQRAEEERLNSGTLPTQLPTPVPPPSVSPTTFGVLNGQAWRILKPFEKTLYLSGAQNALLKETQRPTWIKYVPQGDAERLPGDLDRFYSEPLNINISIVDALHIVVMKANGDPAPDIEDEIKYQREMAMRDPAIKKP
jgi:hypothetical protein